MLLMAGDTVERLPFASETPFAGEIADMEAVALDAWPQRIPLLESRRTVATIAALYRSAREGRTIDG